MSEHKQFFFLEEEVQKRRSGEKLEEVLLAIFILLLYGGLTIGLYNVNAKLKAFETGTVESIGVGGSIGGWIDLLYNVGGRIFTVAVLGLVGTPVVLAYTYIAYVEERLTSRSETARHSSDDAEDKPIVGCSGGADVLTCPHPPILGLLFRLAFLVAGVGGLLYLAYFLAQMALELFGAKPPWTTF